MSRKKILFCVTDIGYEVPSQSCDSSTMAHPSCLEDLTESAFSLVWDNVGDNIWSCFEPRIPPSHTRSVECPRQASVIVKTRGWESLCIAISAQMLTCVTIAAGEMFLPLKRNQRCHLLLPPFFSHQMQGLKPSRRCMAVYEHMSAQTDIWMPFIEFSPSTRNLSWLPSGS